MDPLSVTASIIAVIQLTGSVISAVYNYRKGVNNAPEDAAKIIQDLTGLSHILEQLLQIVEKGMKTLERLNAKLQPENGWRAVKQSLIWPLKQEYIKKTLGEIATARATLGLALTVDQTSLALGTKDGIDALTSSFNSFLSDEERKALLADLSPVDANVNHSEAFRKHQKGTGEWFTKSEQYLEWAAEADSLLWINGIPGCGKTILCSIAIEDLLHNYQPNRPQCAVTYYYFNFQTGAEQQLNNLLRSILSQLFCQCHNLPASIEGLKWRRRKSDLSNEYLTGVAKDLFGCFREAYVVIDAVDECEHSEKAIRWIQELVQSKVSRLHVLVSSRQDHRFRGALESFTTSILDLDSHTFEKDIQLYIKEQLSTDPRMMSWPSDVKNDIEQSLMANAGGLFRWVDCQVNVLRKCLRINNIKGVLDTPPKTLYETYDRIIANIDEAYVEDACKILQWLVFSTRPLSTNELNEVLAFDQSDPQNPIFSPHLRLPLLKDVLTLCPGLVVVSEKKATGLDSSNIESLEVRLAHSSVKDYLVSHHIKSGLVAQFALEAQLAHSVISACCVVYLLQLSSPLNIAMLQEFPLALYAAQYWTEHYRHSEYLDGNLLDRLALQLLTAETAYRNCCSLYNPDKRWQGVELEKDPGLPALYYASLTGLFRMVTPLVARGADLNGDTCRCQFGGPLDAAAYKGHEDCVKALLNVSAKPDGGYYESEYGSPIASAASQGHNAIVGLLLQAGADVNRRGEDGQGSALYHAASSGYSDTVKMLMDAGANANTFAGMSGVIYAIEIAAMRGDRESVCLLFPKVSDRSAARALEDIARLGHRELFETLLQTQRGREMGLQYAARAGWNDLVQSMIDENSSDVNDEESTTSAFCQAATSGSLETMQVLYENRVGKTVSSDELSKAVASAARGGFSLVVKYLLDRGADTESLMCQEALVHAAENGHLSTVQVLLTAGVSANSHYKMTWSPTEKSCLWAAVNREHVEIARLLLTHGAHANTQYDEISALTVSIKHANEELFDLLSEKGTSAATNQVKNASYDTLALPIHYAASAGNIHILRKLLEAGLEIDATLVPDGWTALFHAAKAGHEEVLRILINDYGADVNRRANKGTVAIHTAAYHNHGKCIEVFLDAGVDVNVRGRAGRTSLHWAAQEGSIGAVRVLLDRGADVFIEEKDTFMKAADIAKVKALKVSESQKSEYHWKRPREENYEPIMKMLMEQAAKSQHGLNRHSSTFRRKLRTVIRQKNAVVPG